MLNSVLFINSLLSVLQGLGKENAPHLENQLSPADVYFHSLVLLSVKLIAKAEECAG